MIEIRETPRRVYELGNPERAPQPEYRPTCHDCEEPLKITGPDDAHCPRCEMAYNAAPDCSFIRDITLVIRK